MRKKEIDYSLRAIQKLLTHKAFNPYIDIENPDRVLLHLIEELGEVVKKYRKGLPFGTELGDSVILLCFFAESVEYDLQHETLNKISLNIAEGKFKPNKEFKKVFKGLDLFEK